MRLRGDLMNIISGRTRWCVTAVQSMDTVEGKNKVEESMMSSPRIQSAGSGELAMSGLTQVGTVAEPFSREDKTLSIRE